MNISVIFIIYSIKESCFDSLSPRPVLLNIFLSDSLESPLEFAKNNIYNKFILPIWSCANKGINFLLAIYYRRRRFKNIIHFRPDINCELLLKFTLLFIEFIGVIEIGLAVFF